MQMQSIDHILNHCGCLKESESLVILCDHTTRDLAEAFRNQAVHTTPQVKLVEIPLAQSHGQEPPANAKELMFQAALIVCLCKYSLAHTKARLEAASQGARFLSLPFYSWDLLADPASGVDYRSQAPAVRRVADAFTKASCVHVTGPAGTDVKMDIRGRMGNYCPGFVSGPGELGSPPDIEANVPPVEDSASGLIVVDGSITHADLGLLEQPLKLSLMKGKIQSIDSGNKHYVRTLERIFGSSEPKRRLLAECGVGLNPLAKLSGVMLTDEGALGTVHFGFGSNATVGGQNAVDFHLDVVIRDASLKADHEFILKEGKLVL